MFCHLKLVENNRLHDWHSVQPVWEMKTSQIDRDIKTSLLSSPYPHPPHPPTLPTSLRPYVPPRVCLKDDSPFSYTWVWREWALGQEKEEKQTRQVSALCSNEKQTSKQRRDRRADGDTEERNREGGVDDEGWSCFVALRHGTSGTWSKVAVYCESVGGSGRGWRWGPSGPRSRAEEDCPRSHPGCWSLTGRNSTESRPFVKSTGKMNEPREKQNSEHGSRVHTTVRPLKRTHQSINQSDYGLKHFLKHTQSHTLYIQ